MSFRKKINISVLFFFFLCSVIILYPIIPHFNEKILCGDIDVFGHLWSSVNIFKIFKNYLHIGNSTAIKNIIFYPISTNNPNCSPWSSLFSFYLYFLQYFLGLATAYNLLSLLMIMLTGWSTYLLTEFITKSKPSGIICGALTVFSSSFILQVYRGIPEHYGIYLINFYILSILKVNEKRTKKLFLLSFLLLFLNFLNNVYHFLFLIIFTFIFLIYKKKLKGALITIFFFVVILCIQQFFSGKNSTLCNNINILFNNRVTLQNLLGSFKLSELQPNSPINLLDAVFSKSINLENFLFMRSLPFLSDNYTFSFIWLFAFWALFLNFKESKMWLIILIAFFFLSFGPWITFTNRAPILPLPQIFLYKLFPLLSLLKAFRFYQMVNFSLIILAGFVVKWIFSDQNLTKFHKIIVIITLLYCQIIEIFFLPNKFPSDTFQTKVPDFYNNLSKEKENFAILEIPFYPPTNLQGKYLFYEITHKKFLINSLFATDEDHLKLNQWKKENSFIDFICRISSDNEIINKKDYAIDMEDIRYLQNIGLKYIVLHKEIENFSTILYQSKFHYFSLPLFNTLTDLFGQPEIYESGIIVFHLLNFKPVQEGKYYPFQIKNYLYLLNEESMFFIQSLGEISCPLKEIKKFKGRGHLLFWVFSAQDPDDTKFIVNIEQKIDGKNHLLGSKEIFVKKNYWELVEVLMEEPKNIQGKIKISINRPFGYKECNLLIRNMELCY